MHNDALLEIVLDQVQQDIKDGDLTAFFELLEYVNHDELVGFLSPSRHEDAVKEGLIHEHS